jgi:hypothetical protein
MGSLAPALPASICRDILPARNILPCQTIMVPAVSMTFVYNMFHFIFEQAHLPVGIPANNLGPDESLKRLRLVVPKPEMKHSLHEAFSAQAQFVDRLVPFRT